MSVVGGQSYSRDKSPILASGEEKPTMVVVVEQGAPMSTYCITAISIWPYYGLVCSPRPDHSNTNCLPMTHHGNCSTWKCPPLLLRIPHDTIHMLRASFAPFFYSTNPFLTVLTFFTFEVQTWHPHSVSHESIYCLSEGRPYSCLKLCSILLSFIASIHETDKHISDYQEAFASLP